MKPWDFAAFATQSHQVPEVILSLVHFFFYTGWLSAASITSKLVLDFISNKCITAQLQKLRTQNDPTPPQSVWSMITLITNITWKFHNFKESVNGGLVKIYPTIKIYLDNEGAKTWEDTRRTHCAVMAITYDEYFNDSNVFRPLLLGTHYFLQCRNEA